MSEYVHMQITCIECVCNLSFYHYQVHRLCTFLFGNYVGFPKPRLMYTLWPTDSTDKQNQVVICPFALREVSVLAGSNCGHLHYRLTDVPPQSNSQRERSSERVTRVKKGPSLSAGSMELALLSSKPHWISMEMIKVVVFPCRCSQKGRLPFIVQLSCLFTKPD